MPDARDSSLTKILTEAINRVLTENSLATLVTLVKSTSNVGAKMLVDEQGHRVGSFGNIAVDDGVTLCASHFLGSRAEARTYLISEFVTDATDLSEMRILCERIEPEPQLIICGAGHVGAALAHLARIIGYRTILIDDRQDFVTRERFPDEGIELVVADGWSESLVNAIGAGRNVSVAVVTRGHKEDEECMLAVINARPDYVGLIGSRRRTNIVLDNLIGIGADKNLLKEVRAPIGLDIGAVSPEEVALAILAEVVAFRRGASGTSLSLWRRQEKRELG